MHEPDLIRIRLSDLIPHEATDRAKIDESLQIMQSDGMLKRPIAVYRIPEVGKYLIIDGHHRVEALRKLGCDYVIANNIDYFSSSFKVRSWKGDKEWDKAEIITDALKGKLKGAKSTRHVVVLDADEQSFHRNDVVEPVIDCPLHELI